MTNKEINSAAVEIEAALYYRRDGSDSREGLTEEQTAAAYKIIRNFCDMWHEMTGATPGAEESTALEEVKKETAARLDSLGYNGAEVAAAFTEISGTYAGKPSRVKATTPNGDKIEIFL